MSGDPEAGDDPRLATDQVRTVALQDRRVTLVGVVHDHPASVYRVGRLCERRDPDVLALELPPLAVPLFRQYADDDRQPPAVGGEMSAAIQAANADRVVGIDGPSRRFLFELGRTLVSAQPALGTLRRVVDGLTSAARAALLRRVAATIAARTPVGIDAETPVAHPCDSRDPPADQAADERSQIERARAVTDALEPSRAVRHRDATRERHMARRLREMARDGGVLAVVGAGHLRPVTARLRGRENR